MSTDAQSAKAALSERTQGMIIMATAMLLLPMLDIVGRWLASVDHLSPGQIAFFRFFVQFVIFAAFIAATAGMRALIPYNVPANMIRGMLLGGASLLMAIAVKYMPVADALAIFFVEPLILTVLSAIVLKERVGWRRRSAVMIGFAGALIVVRPSYAIFGAVSFLPLATAFLFALYLILNRRLARDDSPVVMQMTAGLSASLMLGIAVAAGAAFDLVEFAPAMPKYGISWLLLVTLGFISAAGHLMVVQAFQRAQSSLLAPFQYLEIVTATIFGLLLFGEFPDALRWLGIAIIVTSGLYTFWRESRAREAEA